MIHQPALQARLDIWPNDLWKQCFTTIGMEVFVCFPHFQVRPVGAPLSRHFIPFLIRNQFKNWLSAILPEISLVIPTLDSFRLHIHGGLISSSPLRQICEAAMARSGVLKSRPAPGQR